MDIFLKGLNILNAVLSVYARMIFLVPAFLKVDGNEKLGGSAGRGQ